MELVSSAWHVISSAIVFVMGAFIVNALRAPFNIKQNRAFLIYLWHTLFCVAYMIYSLEYGADSVTYYLKSFQSGFEFKLGTAGVVFLTSFLTLFIDLSYLGVFLIFNIFGVIGLLAFDASLKVATLNKSKYIKYIATLFVFLPSVSFWTSAIGKDSLAFMAVGLALWAALNLRRGWGIMVIAVLIILLVRPHMAGIMVLTLSGALILQRNFSLSYRLLMGCMAVITAFVLIPFTLNYAGLGIMAEMDINTVSTYIQNRQGYNQRGGGGIDISLMSFPMQLFAYLFRPLPFEAHSIFALISSIENVFLLLVFLSAIRGMLLHKRHNVVESRTYMWLYVSMSWVVLGLTTANLGISVRQKWMFVPLLAFLLISHMGRYKRLKVIDHPSTQSSVSKL